MKQPQWIVLNERGFVVVDHSCKSEASAKSWAKACAEKAPGETYVVYQSIGECRSQTVVWEDHDPNPPL